MGVMYSMPSYNYHQLQERMKHDIVLINTMDIKRQFCLIKGTLKAENEVEIMNKLLKTNKNKEIIVYGIHHTDLSVIKKYNQ